MILDKAWFSTFTACTSFPLLQQQHLIELIRLRETESALEFAQTQLAEQGEESRECLTEMERTLALLAFDNPEESPFGDLLNMMQRQKVDASLMTRLNCYFVSLHCFISWFESRKKWETWEAILGSFHTWSSVHLEKKSRFILCNIIKCFSPLFVS